MKRTARFVAILITVSLLFLTASCSLDIKGHKPSKNYSKIEATEISVGGFSKYHFSKLSNLEKHAYNNILTDIKSFPKKIEIPPLSEDSLNAVYTALLNDNPELFFLDKTCRAESYRDVAYFCPSYAMTSDEYTSMMKKCVDAANEIVGKAMEEESAFERERIVHDEIIKRCSYSNESSNTYRSSIYGVLIYKNASCEGYAKTAKYLFDLLKMESYVITGSSYAPSGEIQSHMWNIINLGGDYYNLDLTWDDPVTDNGLPMIFYTYFNVSDDVLGKTHFDFENANKCTETDNYFFKFKGLEFSEFSREEKRTVADFAADIIDNGSCGFQICLNTKETFEKVSGELFSEEGIYSLLCDIRENCETDFATDKVSYVLSENYNIIDVIIEVG